MAQLALSAHNQAEVTTSIARGMEILGPSISLDTLVTALVIRVGTLSGVHRLESLCSFAVMSVIVNYVVFMTFYPACLSLILELTRHGVDVARSVKARGKDSLLMRALYDEDQKPNPVVQRVKIIMSTGLIIVHAHRYTDRVRFGGGYSFGTVGGLSAAESDRYTHNLAFFPSLVFCSRYSFSDKDTVQEVSLSNAPHSITLNRTEPTDFTGYIMKYETTPPKPPHEPIYNRSPPPFQVDHNER